MPHFLAIDGGGTTTTCLVADEKSVIATATASGSNVIRLGEEQARTALHSAIRQACAAAVVDPKMIKRTCAGMAGGARPEISGKIQHIVGEICGGQIQIVGDMIIALEAAFSGGPGVVVIAGTGALAFGRNAHGQTWRAGGWGFAISDEGSGHWIGRTAIRFALRARDEGHNTELLAEIMRAFQVREFEDLVRSANAPGADFAAISPAVLRLAEKDDFARGVLAFAGRELAEQADIVIRHIWDPDQHVPVAVVGGVFRNSALLREFFYNDLRALWPAINPVPGQIEPVLGALYLARNS
jgi:N-acetylglucosamine kinase-like BadF-type ATPase